MNVTSSGCEADIQVCIVFGAGPVGLLCMAVAKALGARRVIAVDINQERLDFAKSYAATDIYLPVCLFLPPRYPLLSSFVHQSNPLNSPRALDIRLSGANKQGPKEGDEDIETYCARIAAKLCGDLDIPAMGPGAIDLTIEASGAPTCIQIGVHVLKPSYVHLSF